MIYDANESKTQLIAKIDESCCDKFKDFWEIAFVIEIVFWKYWDTIFSEISTQILNFHQLSNQLYKKQMW